MTHIIPKLSLSHVLDSALGEYAQEKIDKITLAPAFAAVVPSTAAVDAKNIEWMAALTKADDGNRADTAYKNQIRAELVDMLTLQAQNCAEIANGDLPLYLTSGYEAKAKGTPKGPLPQVTGVRLSFTNNAGELHAGWNAMQDALNFTVWVYSDSNNADGSLIKQYIVGKIGRGTTLLDGLPSGQLVLVRVRANGGSTGFGDWSSTMEQRIP